MEESENVGAVHPAKNACFLSRLLYLWTIPLLFKKTDPKYYGFLEEYDCASLTQKLENEWTRQCKATKSPSLWKVFFNLFYKKIIITGVLALVMKVTFIIYQPFFIDRLLEYFTPNQTKWSRSNGLSYILALIALWIMQSVIYNYVLVQMMCLGVKCREACSGMIYRKITNLSKQNLEEVTNLGKIINLLSNDANFIDAGLSLGHLVWTTPIEVVVAGTCLYFRLGYSAVIGASIFLLAIICESCLLVCSSNCKKHTNDSTERRIRLMNEFISGIQILKINSWNKQFAEKIIQIRNLETNLINRLTTIKGVNLTFKIFMSSWAMSLTMIMAFAFGVNLNSRLVFVIYSYYSILKNACGYQFPAGMFSLIETNNSFRRIQRFFLLKLQTNAICSNNIKPNLSFEAVTAKWNLNLSDDCLTNVNLEACSGEITAIIGPSGGGKTALLHTILGETCIVKGVLSVKGSISFASQDPWIFPASLRQNILFGEAFDKSRYLTVLKVCQLEHDISLFSDGDLSLVGERGVLLSGGQKARLNLARAVYRSADIYLLDDPLSAVDSLVAKYIFENCILDFLANKCVVLVTHQENILEMVQHVYVLDKGKITKQEKTVKCSELKSQFFKNMAIEETKEIYPKKFNSTKKICIDEQPTPLINGLYRYFKTVGISNSILLALLFLIVQFLSNANDFFLNFWINSHQMYSQKLLNDTSSISIAKTENYLTTTTFLYIYTAVCIVTAFCALLRSALFASCCSKCSSVLHHTVIGKVSTATLQFFNTEKSGVILNKFSKEMGAMDHAFPAQFLNTLQNALHTVGSLILISITNYVCVLPTIVFLGILSFSSGWFTEITNQTKVENIKTKTPIFTQTVVSVQGLTTIRAMNAKKILITEFDKLQSKNCIAVYLQSSLKFVISVVADCLCILYIFIILLCFYFLQLELQVGSIGLIIVQILAITYILQGILKDYSDLILSCASIGHIQKYCTLPSELDDGTIKPPENWPFEGNITLNQLSLQYFPNQPSVLKNISFRIYPKEKIGIIGRTGSGKSSLISTFFRLYKFTGTITIDTLDICQIPLKTLRERLAIIPQNPVLFSGSIRQNLDPFDNFSDVDVWQALEEVNMKKSICNLSHELETNVQENGSNFSSGERQLLCLARAILRKTRILILDEISASIDLETDQRIQSAIRRKFKEATLLTITHRLYTVMDSDRILVLQDGEVIEFDSPCQLLQKPNGYLQNQVMRNGEEVMEELLTTTRPHSIKNNATESS